MPMTTGTKILLIRSAISCIGGLSPVVWGIFLKSGEGPTRGINTDVFQWFFVTVIVGGTLASYVMSRLPEEKGQPVSPILIGNAILLVLYLLLIGRAMVITANASTVFARLLAGAITLMFFTCAFVNMAMVSGLLPVVGVPLPLVSYGGTAMISLFIGLGILMSVQAHRKLVMS